MKNSLFGYAALLLSVIALGFAVIPGRAMDQPLPTLQDKSDSKKPEPEPTPPADEKPEKKAGVTLEYKGISVTFGGEKKEKAEETKDEEQPEVEGEKKAQLATAAEPAPREETEAERQTRLFKMFSLVSFSCVLLAFVLAPISWVKEDQQFLAGSALAVCCLAIAWEYVLLGIGVAVCIAVLIWVLPLFADFV